METYGQRIKQAKAFCGQQISGNYSLAEQLPVPIVTPAKKAAQGHDEYISMEQLTDELGKVQPKSFVRYLWRCITGVINTQKSGEFSLPIQNLNLAMMDRAH